mgnify:CR=1
MKSTALPISCDEIFALIKDNKDLTSVFGSELSTSYLEFISTLK